MDKVLQLLNIQAVRYAAIIGGLVLVSFFLLPGVRMGALSADFLPHATCYLQEPRLILLHATSDALIGLAYLAISCTIGYLVYRARQDIPFHWMFMAFGLFIVACGFTHVMAVITVWHPIYWLSADVKVITAVASVTTAIALPFLVPKVFTLIHSAKLSEERQESLVKANEELRDLNEKIRELDTLKSQFFANVSHELRTPLTLILGPTEKLLNSTDLKPDHLEQVETIQRNSTLLLGQVNNLLEASRLENAEVTVNYQSVDITALSRLVASHFATLAEDKQITFELDAPDRLMVEADPEKIERVLLNLLGNAFKFVPQDGSIRCRVISLGEHFQIQVQDNGPGVPLEMRQTVFERFRQVDGASTRRFGGSGLGLAIVKDLVELHGGSVSIEESPGGGATFIVELPAKAPEGVSVSSEKSVESPPSRASRSGLGIPNSRTERPRPSPPELTGRPVVLVIEDDPDMNRFISGILRERFDVVSAFDGQEGFDQAISHKPDLIISDIMMPKISGDELLLRLRREEGVKETPIILVSARADDDLRIDLLRKGATDYLLKPFSVQEVQAKATNLMALSLVRRALQQDLNSREDDLATLAEEMIVRKKDLEKALQNQREAEERLRSLNTELEERVAHRTKELETANNELKSFTSTATHDLRAPLRTIAGMAAILAEDHQASLDAEARDYLDRIRSSAKRMDVLIQDLFAYSRVGRASLSIEPFALGTIIQIAHDTVSEEIRTSNAEVEIQPTDAKVLAHETLLTQAIANLLSNAIKYVAAGTRPKVTVTTEQRDGTIRLLVHDNGIGIKQEDQERIFGLFQRLHRPTDYPGTGLGLAIFAKAVERMNGTYGVQSVPGKGSTFWLELPKAGD